MQLHYDSFTSVEEQNHIGVALLGATPQDLELPLDLTLLVRLEANHP